MKIPQAVMLLIMASRLGVSLVKDGDPKEGRYDFFLTLIGVTIQYALLKWGRFF